MNRGAQHLLLRALAEHGFLGPSFFKGGPSRRMRLPDGVPYPFGGRCLPLAYAEWYAHQVERPGPRRSTLHVSSSV